MKRLYATWLTALMLTAAGCRWSPRIVWTDNSCPPMPDICGATLRPPEVVNEGPTVQRHIDAPAASLTGAYPYAAGPSGPCPPAAGAPMAGTPATCPPTGCPCPPAAGDKSCPTKPSVFHVKVPQQKVIIEDKYECPKPKGKPLGKPKEDEETRSQQVMGAVSQEVILVPRTVYVPYVAQTPTVPVRMLSAQAASAVVDETPPKKGLGGPGPQPEEKKPLGGPAPKPCETTIQEPCAPTTIIELQRANQRLDLLHRLLDRLCDKDNR